MDVQVVFAKFEEACLIQALAGHSEIVTTQRYMHHSPAAIESANRLLNQPIGSMLATAPSTV